MSCLAPFLGRSYQDFSFNIISIPSLSQNIGNKSWDFWYLCPQNAFAFKILTLSYRGALGISQLEAISHFSKTLGRGSVRQFWLWAWYLSFSITHEMTNIYVQYIVNIWNIYSQYMFFVTYIGYIWIIYLFYMLHILNIYWTYIAIIYVQ